MLMTADELKGYISTDLDATVLEAKLRALELLIRKATNNNFQQRGFRAYAASIASGKTLLVDDSSLFRANDTLQISESALNEGLVTVRTSSNGAITVKEELYDESPVLITKILYPADVKMGAVNMLKWDLENRDKVGVASESVSRHSVTYFNMDGENSVLGYPKSLTGFLEPYVKARF